MKNSLIGAAGLQIFIGCMNFLEAGLYVFYFRKRVVHRKYMYPHYMNLIAAFTILDIAWLNVR